MHDWLPSMQTLPCAWLTRAALRATWCSATHMLVLELHASWATRCMLTVLLLTNDSALLFAETQPPV